jgi:hypothetical protein
MLRKIKIHNNNKSTSKNKEVIIVIVTMKFGVPSLGLYKHAL